MRKRQEMDSLAQSEKSQGDFLVSPGEFYSPAFLCSQHQFLHQGTFFDNRVIVHRLKVQLYGFPDIGLRLF